MDHRSRFQRDVFANIYLMLLSIVQAAVFVALAQDTTSYIATEYGSAELSWDGLLSDPQLWRAFATLAAIGIITFEYSYFVMMMHKAIRAWDIYILFLLGIIQFAMASLVDNSYFWWCSNVAFALGGLVAFVNTWTFDFAYNYDNNQRKVSLQRWHTTREMAIVTLAGLYSFFVLTTIDRDAMYFESDIPFTAFWVFFFGSVMLWNSNHYISRMTALDDSDARSLPKD